MLKMAFLLCLLVICRLTFCEEMWTSSNGDIVDFAFGMDKLFVQTNTWIYQLSLNLILEMSNETNYNAMGTLAPFLSNGTLIVCGSSHYNPYCDVLDINDISKRIHMEGISIGSNPNVAFIIGHHSEKFLLVAVKNSIDSGADAWVTLRSTSNAQSGGIFSRSGRKGTAGIQPIEGTAVQVVDGFELTASLEVYLFVNVMSGSVSSVKLLSLDSSKTQYRLSAKRETFKTLQGAVLQCYEGQSWILLSSAVIPGDSPVLWTGVFQSEKNPLDSVVAIFNISRSLTGKVTGFCTNTERCDKQPENIADKILTPVLLLLRKASVTSVAVLRSNSWIMLFCSTETGLLIRVALDESLKPGCLNMLYSSYDDQPFSRKMLFNPVNHTHIYLVQGTQMRKIPVAQCEVYKSLSDCWSAIDPFCGWCVSDHKCTFQHDCSPSDWVSVPGTAKKREVISVHMNRDGTGQDIMVTASPNLNASIDFSCSIEECDNPGPVNTCSCTFSNDSFPAEGLNIKVKIMVQRETHIQKVHLKNCPSIRGTPTSALCMECISAGCEWTSDSECTWRPSAYTQLSEDGCKGLPSGLNDEPKPEVLSMTPSEVSIHGQNGAIITGRSLKSVTKVRLQGTLDCNPKESPVLYSTNAGSEFLTFNIPSGTKGTVRVCVLTLGDQCHGNATLTYDSPPTCRRLQPKTTWVSGGRKIQILGSKLKFVDQVKHADWLADMTSEFISETLVYSSPPGDSLGEVSVDLTVANQSVRCSQTLSYLPNPQFTSFTPVQMGKNTAVYIQKTADSLGLNGTEIQVEALQWGESYECEVQGIEHSDDASTVICKISDQAGLSIDTIKITVGEFSETLTNMNYSCYIIRVPIYIIYAICVGMVFWYYNRKTQRMLKTNTSVKRSDRVIE